MKKLIIIISLVFATFGFVSCNNNWEHVEDTSVSIREIEYNGHTYLQFKDHAEYGMTILHSPDCKCYTDTVKQ